MRIGMNSEMSPVKSTLLQNINEAFVSGIYRGRPMTEEWRVGKESQS